jgi:hypothetical protein
VGAPKLAADTATEQADDPTQLALMMAAAVAESQAPGNAGGLPPTGVP